MENAIERAVIIASGRQIELDDLPEAICRTALEARAQRPHDGRAVSAAHEEKSIKLEVAVPSSMEDIEHLAIAATLDYTAGDKTRAARALGIGRKTLYRKLQRYNGKQESEDGSQESE